MDIYTQTFGPDAPNRTVMVKKVQQVLTAYLAFFDHIALRKGWRTVPFAAAEVQPLFGVAAQVVVLLRERIDEDQ